MVIYFFITVSVLFCACQSYQPQPIIPTQSLEKIDSSRKAMLTDRLETQQPVHQQFTFLKAVKILGTNSPILKEVRAEYKKIKDIAAINTPLPNPRLELGALIGTQLGNDSGGRVQPLVAFGFTIPLSSRLTKQDEVNTAAAKYAYLRYVLQHRSEYLKLRKIYIDLLFLEEHRKLHDRIINTVNNSSSITKELVAAGVTTAFDVGIIELEVLQKSAQLKKIERQILQLKGKLSEILGINSKFFQFTQPQIYPQLPSKMPSVEQLKKILLSNHPQLALLRASHEIVEKRLHLEITKQTPDLIVSPSFEGDPGEDRNVWGVSVRFPVPIFDKNQVAIKSQEGQRRVIKTKYDSTLNRALARMEASHADYVLQKNRHNQAKVISKKAQENVELALEILKRGELNFIRYIDTERSLANSLLEMHSAKKAMYYAWMEVEKIIGMPLSLLPQEQEQEQEQGATTIKDLFSPAKGVQE
ncbi:TolC family protein [Candidatus Uabimicrobium sp. HlEnr_7]|uniref:TolC family protein n=1 Tax=Candidatus Uabimicrobium helgolandensis TaxID=3095367 RepID=UPI003556391E